MNIRKVRTALVLGLLSVCPLLKGQRPILVTLDSGVLQVDTPKNSVHYMPWMFLHLPTLGIDRRDFVAGLEGDAFWDSFGSVHAEYDLWSLNLPTMKSRHTRRKSEIGINAILFRREKLKSESFFVEKYNSAKTTMEFYKVQVRMQRSWQVRLGIIQLRNPMVQVNYRFTDGGSTGIPSGRKYIDTHVRRDNIMHFGLGRVRKKYFNGVLNMPNAQHPKMYSYAFFYADFLIALNEPHLASQLPYSDEPKDKPTTAPVSGADKFSKLGFRIGLCGTKYKRNQFPFYYQAEFGSYPNYPIGKGFYWRGVLGYRLTYAARVTK